jgi:uncharacterized membrane protein YgcG
MLLALAQWTRVKNEGYAEVVCAWDGVCMCVLMCACCVCVLCARVLMFVLVRVRVCVKRFVRVLAWCVLVGVCVLALCVLVRVCVCWRCVCVCWRCVCVCVCVGWGVCVVCVDDNGVSGESGDSCGMMTAVGGGSDDNGDSGDSGG